MATVIPIKPLKPHRSVLTPENKCGYCTGSKCCNYITQRIDAPRAIEDFEMLMWQISHGNVEAFKDSDGWFLLIATRCQHLQVDGRCGIYEHRPEICREYTNDFCEYDEPAEKHFDIHFRTYDDVVRYCRKRFKAWGRRHAAQRAERAQRLKQSAQATRAKA